MLTGEIKKHVSEANVNCGKIVILVSTTSRTNQNLYTYIIIHFRTTTFIKLFKLSCKIWEYHFIFPTEKVLFNFLLNCKRTVLKTQYKRSYQEKVSFRNVTDVVPKILFVRALGHPAKRFSFPTEIT